MADKCGAANAGGGFIFICILEKDHVRSHLPVQISVNNSVEDQIELLIMQDLENGVM